MRRSRGGPNSPYTKESQKYGFLSNTGQDPLKNHKATKPTFSVGLSWAHQRRWPEFSGILDPLSPTKTMLSELDPL